MVVVGTGLTAIDTAITLLGDSPRRRVVMVSRRGRLPASHIDQKSTAWVSEVPPGPLTADGVAAFVRTGRGRARLGVDWRAVVDGLRPQTQSIWRRLASPNGVASCPRTPATGRYAGTGRRPRSPPGSRSTVAKAGW